MGKNKEEIPETPAAEKNEQEKVSEESYSFLNEHVKEGPLNRRRILIRIGELFGAGAVFGLAACLVFCGISPWASRRFSGEKSNQVTIPEDDPQTAADPGDEPEGGVASTVDGTTLTTDNYIQMMSGLNRIASDAFHSMVTVIGIKDGEDEFNSSYVNPKKSAGVIAASTVSELLILSPDYVADGVSAFHVRFGNGVTVDASLKMRDASSGLAVFAVKISSFSDNVKDYYEVAELGNSYSASIGTPIILLGNLFSDGIGQAYGIVSSTSDDCSIPDGKMRLLTSDVGGGQNSSGVFLNTNGEVIGFILPRSSDGASSAITAYPISDIKKLIEDLSNGTPVPYIGVYGMDISKTVAEEQGLREGIYVTQAALDSPAMTAGLQSGDIIREVDNQNIRTMQAFRSTLLNHAAGDTIEIGIQRPNRDSYSHVTIKVTIGSQQTKQ